MSTVHKWSLTSTPYTDTVTNDTFISSGTPSISSDGTYFDHTDYLYIDNKYNDWKNKVFTFWIKPDNGFTLLNMIFGWDMLIDPTQDELDALATAGINTITVSGVPLYSTSFNFEANQQYFVVYSETDRKMYVNTVNQTITTKGTYNVVVADRFGLGNFGSATAITGTQKFKGYISDFRVMNELPSEAVIKRMYKSGPNVDKIYIIRDKTLNNFYYINPTTSSWEQTASNSTSIDYQITNYGMPFSGDTSDILAFNVNGVDDYDVIILFVDELSSDIHSDIQAYPKEKTISTTEVLSYDSRDTLSTSNVTEDMNGSSTSSFTYALYNITTNKYYTYNGSAWEEITGDNGENVNAEKIHSKGMSRALLEAGMSNTANSKEFLLGDGAQWKIVISALNSDIANTELDDATFDRDRDMTGYRICKDYDYKINHKDAEIRFFAPGKYKINY